MPKKGHTSSYQRTRTTNAMTTRRAQEGKPKRKVTKPVKKTSRYKKGK